MEMGCGKTKVLIDSSSYLYDNGFVFGILVVCPNGVKGTWVNEIETHMATHVDRNVVVWTGQKTKKHEEEFRLSLLLCSCESNGRIIRSLRRLGRSFYTNRECEMRLCAPL